MDLCRCCRCAHRNLHGGAAPSKATESDEELLNETLLSELGDSSLSWLDDLTESYLTNNSEDTAGASLLSQNASVGGWSPCPKGGVFTIPPRKGRAGDVTSISALLASSHGSPSFKPDRAVAVPSPSCDELGGDQMEIKWSTSMATPFQAASSFSPSMNESDWRDKSAIRDIMTPLSSEAKPKVIHRKLFSPASVTSHNDSLSLVFDAVDGNVTLEQEKTVSNEEEVSTFFVETGQVSQHSGSASDKKGKTLVVPEKFPVCHTDLEKVGLSNQTDEAKYSDTSLNVKMISIGERDFSASVNQSMSEAMEIEWDGDQNVSHEADIPADYKKTLVIGEEDTTVLNVDQVMNSKQTCQHNDGRNISSVQTRTSVIDSACFSNEDGKTNVMEKSNLLCTERADCSCRDPCINKGLKSLNNTAGVIVNSDQLSGCRTCGEAAVGANMNNNLSDSLDRIALKKAHVISDVGDVRDIRVPGKILYVTVDPESETVSQKKDKVIPQDVQKDVCDDSSVSQKMTDPVNTSYPKSDIIPNKRKYTVASDCVKENENDSFNESDSQFVESLSAAEMELVEEQCVKEYQKKEASYSIISTCESKAVLSANSDEKIRLCDKRRRDGNNGVLADEIHPRVLLDCDNRQSRNHIEAVLSKVFASQESMENGNSAEAMGLLMNETVGCGILSPEDNRIREEGVGEEQLQFGHNKDNHHYDKEVEQAHVTAVCIQDSVDGEKLPVKRTKSSKEGMAKKRKLSQDEFETSSVTQIEKGKSTIYVARTDQQHVEQDESSRKGPETKHSTPQVANKLVSSSIRKTVNLNPILKDPQTPRSLVRKRVRFSSESSPDNDSASQKDHSDQGMKAQHVDEIPSMRECIEPRMNTLRDSESLRDTMIDRVQTFGNEIFHNTKPLPVKSNSEVKSISEGLEYVESVVGEFDDDESLVNSSLSQFDQHSCQKDMKHSNGDLLISSQVENTSVVCGHRDGMECSHQTDLSPVQKCDLNKVNSSKCDTMENKPSNNETYEDYNFSDSFEVSPTFSSQVLLSSQVEEKEVLNHCGDGPICEMEKQVTPIGGEKKDFTTYGKGKANESPECGSVQNTGQLENSTCSKAVVNDNFNFDDDGDDETVCAAAALLDNADCASQNESCSHVGDRLVANPVQESYGKGSPSQNCDNISNDVDRDTDGGGTTGIARKKATDTTADKSEQGLNAIDLPVFPSRTQAETDFTAVDLQDASCLPSAATVSNVISSENSRHPESASSLVSFSTLTTASSAASTSHTNSKTSGSMSHTSQTSSRHSQSLKTSLGLFASKRRKFIYPTAKQIESVCPETQMTKDTSVTNLSPASFPLALNDKDDNRAETREDTVAKTQATTAKKGVTVKTPKLLGFAKFSDVFKETKMNQLPTQLRCQSSPSHIQMPVHVDNRSISNKDHSAPHLKESTVPRTQNMTVVNPVSGNSGNINNIMSSSSKSFTLSYSTASIQQVSGATNSLLSDVNPSSKCSTGGEDKTEDITNEDDDTTFSTQMWAETEFSQLSKPDEPSKGNHLSEDSQNYSQSQTINHESEVPEGSETSYLVQGDSEVTENGLSNERINMCLASKSVDSSVTVTKVSQEAPVAMTGFAPASNMLNSSNPEPAVGRPLEDEDFEDQLEKMFTAHRQKGHHKHNFRTPFKGADFTLQQAKSSNRIGLSAEQMYESRDRQEKVLGPNSACMSQHENGKQISKLAEFDRLFVRMESGDSSLAHAPTAITEHHDSETTLAQSKYTGRNSEKTYSSTCCESEERQMAAVSFKHDSGRPKSTMNGINSSNSLSFQDKASPKSHLETSVKTQGTMQQEGNFVGFLEPKKPEVQKGLKQGPMTGHVTASKDICNTKLSVSSTDVCTVSREKAGLSNDLGCLNSGFATASGKDLTLSNASTKMAKQLWESVSNEAKTPVQVSERDVESELDLEKMFDRKMKSLNRDANPLSKPIMHFKKPAVISDETEKSNTPKFDKRHKGFQPFKPPKISAAARKNKQKSLGCQRPNGVERTTEAVVSKTGQVETVLSGTGVWPSDTTESEGTGEKECNNLKCLWKASYLSASEPAKDNSSMQNGNRCHVTIDEASSVGSAGERQGKCRGDKDNGIDKLPDDWEDDSDFTDLLDDQLINSDSGRGESAGQCSDHVENDIKDFIGVDGNSNITNKMISGHQTVVSSHTGLDSANKMITIGRLERCPQGIIECRENKAEDGTTDIETPMEMDISGLGNVSDCAWQAEVDLDKSIRNACNNSNSINDCLGGFSTASGKRVRVKVSDSALKQAKSLLDDAEILHFEETESCSARGNLSSDVNSKFSSVSEFGHISPEKSRMHTEKICSEVKDHTANTPKSPAVVDCEVSGAEVMQDSDVALECAGKGDIKNKTTKFGKDDPKSVEIRNPTSAESISCETNVFEVDMKTSETGADRSNLSSLNRNNTQNNPQYMIAATATTHGLPFSDMPEHALIQSGQCSQGAEGNVELAPLKISSTNSKESSTTKCPINMGFLTASGLSVSVSQKAMKHVRHLLADSGDNQDVAPPQLVTAAVSLSNGRRPSHFGFTTASGSSVKVSEEALEKAKEFFEEVEVETAGIQTISRVGDASTTSVCTGFTTASASSVTVPDRALKPALQTLTSVEDEVDLTASKISHGITKSSANTAPLYMGFATAAGLAVTVSEKALRRAKQVLQDTEDKMDTLSPKTDQESVINETNASSHSVEFAVSSSSAVAKSEKCFEEADVKMDIISHKSISSTSNSATKTTPLCIGFATASGTAVTVSEKAMKCAKQFLDNPDDSHDRSRQTNSTRITENSCTPDAGGRNCDMEPTDQISVSGGFLTAGGNRVKISEAALKQARAEPSSEREGQEGFCDREIVTEGTGIRHEDGTGESAHAVESPRAQSVGDTLTPSIVDRVKLRRRSCTPLRSDVEEFQFDRRNVRGKRLSALHSKPLETQQVAAPHLTANPSLSFKPPYKKARICNSDNDLLESGISSCHKNLMKNHAIPFSSSASSVSSFQQSKTISSAKKGPVFLPKKAMADTVSKTIPREEGAAVGEECDLDDEEENKLLCQESESGKQSSPENKLNDRNYSMPNVDNASKPSLEDLQSRRKDVEHDQCTSMRTQVACDSVDSAGSAKTFRNMKTNSIIEECALEMERMKQEKMTRNKKKQRVRPLCGQWLDARKCKRSMRTYQDWGLDPVKDLSRDELMKLSVSESVMDISSQNAKDFRFDLHRFFPALSSSVLVGDGALLVPDRHGFAGVTEFYRAFLTLNGVDPALVDEAWLENHYRWIVWKLAANEVCFPQQLAGRSLTPHSVMLQLKYRYDREIDNCQRSAIKKIVEKDDTPCKRMVLCVATVTKISEEQYVVEVTDGWYAIQAQLDGYLMGLIQRKKVGPGDKIVTSGAELVGCQEACSPLEVKEGTMLKLNGNSTRPAPWHARLGYCVPPSALCVPLGSLHPGGGMSGVVDVVVARKYPVMFMERLPEGGCVFRLTEEEDRVRQKDEEKRQAQLEKMYNSLQTDMEDNRKGRKTGCQKFSKKDVDKLWTGQEIADAIDSAMNPEEVQQSLSTSQMERLMQYKQAEVDRRQQEMNKKLQEAMADAGNKPRNVAPVQKFRLLGCCRSDIDEKLNCLVTVWRPGPEWSEIGEGKRYKLFNLSVSANRNRNDKCKVCLTATRQSYIEARPIGDNLLDLVYEPRDVWTVSELKTKQPGQEFDFVGVVIQITSAQRASGPTVVYASDKNRDILHIRIWSSHQAGNLKMKRCFVASSLTLSRNHQLDRGVKSHSVTADARSEFTTFSTSAGHLGQYSDVFSQLEKLSKAPNFLQSMQAKIGPQQQLLSFCKEPRPTGMSGVDDYYEDFPPEIIEKIFTPMSQGLPPDQHTGNRKSSTVGPNNSKSERSTLSVCRQSITSADNSANRCDASYNEKEKILATSKYAETKGPLIERSVTSNDNTSNSSSVEEAEDVNTNSELLKKRKLALRQKMSKLLAYERPSPLTPLSSRRSPAVGKKFVSPVLKKV